jgi:hypothetical protein
MTEHKPSVVLRWHKEAQIAYLTGLHEALAALRPVVQRAVEWSEAPDDQKLRDALLEAVRAYRWGNEEDKAS